MGGGEWEGGSKSSSLCPPPPIWAAEAVPASTSYLWGSNPSSRPGEGRRTAGAGQIWSLVEGPSLYTTHHPLSPGPRE